MCHPDGDLETGALGRFRPDAPRVGHTFSTVLDDAPVSWVVVEERLARDDDGKPFHELTADRDYSKRDEPPSMPEHELEHTLARDDDLGEATAGAGGGGGGGVARRAGRARARGGSGLG